MITSRTKVAPLKEQTIPRLELMAALLLARLVHTTIRALAYDTVIYCWTDSTCVLYWIHRDKPKLEQIIDIKRFSTLTKLL